MTKKKTKRGEYKCLTHNPNRGEKRGTKEGRKGKGGKSFGGGGNKSFWGEYGEKRKRGR